MGYYTTFNGTINLDKPINMKDANDLKEEVEDLDYMGSWDHEGECFNLCESGKWYNAKQDVAKAAKFLTGRGYKISGIIDCHGEEGGDVWKMEIKGDKVFYAQAKLTFTEWVHIKAE